MGEELVSPQDIQIQIVHTDNTADSSQKEYIFSAGYPEATNVTNRLLYFGAAPPPPPPEIVYDTKKIFIVHEHDDNSKTNYQNILQRMGLDRLDCYDANKQTISEWQRSVISYILNIFPRRLFPLIAFRNPQQMI
jgi:hypothetical protein